MSENNERAIDAFNDYCDNFSTEGIIDYDLTNEAFDVLIKQYGFSYRNYNHQGFAMYDAHGKGIVEGDTEDSMNTRISDYYQSLKSKIDSLGFDLAVGGRSGAWWGIELSTTDPKEIFKLSDAAIEHFNELADADSMDDYEIIQDVIDYSENSFELTDSFIECMKAIKDDIDSTNEKWQAGNFDESMTFFNTNTKSLKENKMVEHDAEAVSLTVDAVTDRYTEDEINDMDPDDLYEACFEAACNYLDENYKQYYMGVGEAAYNALKAGETSSPNKGVNEVLKALTKKFNKDEIDDMSPEDLQQACQMTASGYTDEIGRASCRERV